MSDKIITRNRLGELEPKYNFSLNPYPELRFSRCPDCGAKTGQRKLPLIVHVEPKNLILLNYTNRYCKKCDMLIGHKQEIEHHLTETFLKIKPDVVGRNYLVFGTVEKKVWSENIDHAKTTREILKHAHDFISYQDLRMSMAGWFPKGQEPPIIKPPPSMEWIKKN